MTSTAFTSQIAETLQNSRLFAGLPLELVRELCQGVEVVTCEPEEIIFREAQAGDCLYIVCEGTVRISKLGRGGQQETLGFIEAGNFFGEMALIDGHPRSAQSSASTRCVLSRISQKTFDRILALAPGELHMNFLRTVVERLRGVNSHFITEIMRTERLSTVGSMANSIIHDLKNPITVIRSCADLLAMRAEDATTTELTRLMNKAVDGMTDMIQELLDFARGQTSVQLERHTARIVLSDLESQVVRLLPERIHMIRDGDCDAPLMVDIGRFTRMLANLIKNSIEAMPKGGILWVGSRTENRRVIFKVSDTGCGISPELQSRIFEPFVSHGKSKGTGLGLAIVKSVAEAHGGTVSLRSQEGIGTTIEVSVPFAEEDTLAVAPSLAA
jgi:signal transduction histidine kinase